MSTIKDRLMVSMTNDKLINLPVDRWHVDSIGTLQVIYKDEVVFTAAPGMWISAGRGIWGDVFIKPGGYLVKAPEPEPAQPEGTAA